MKMGQNPTSSEFTKPCPGGAAEGPPHLRRGTGPLARDPRSAAHVARLLALSPRLEALGLSCVAIGTCVVLRAALATGHGSSSMAHGARG